MRIVADTNTVVSAFLWFGAPRHMFNAARDGLIELFTSNLLLSELEDVLGRRKFTARFALVGSTLEEIITDYKILATSVEPAQIAAVIHEDPDDDAVLACAVAAGADMIVSGDRHLLDLTSFEGIPILQAADALILIHGRTNSLSD